MRDNVAMAEGLLGLLTEQELHIASARLGRQGRRWPVALAPYVQRGLGAESGRYTEASPTKRVPSRETSTCSPGFHFIMIKPGNYIYHNIKLNRNKFSDNGTTHHSEHVKLCRKPGVRTP